MAEPYSERAHKQIQVESWSNSARELLLRGYSEAGAFAESHTTNADRSVATDTFEVHGDPISVTVSPLTGPVRRGECYVRVTLMMDGEPVKRLMAAYLTDGKTLAWPPGVHEGFTEGPGLIRFITGTNPAANAEMTETVPTNAVWKVRALALTLVTDANAANRGVKLLFQNDTPADLFFIPDPVAHTASLSWTYYYALANERRTGVVDTGRLAMIIPELLLKGGYIVRTSTSGKQAGDDYAAPVMQVEEWIEE